MPVASNSISLQPFARLGRQRIQTIIQQHPERIPSDGLADLRRERSRNSSRALRERQQNQRHDASNADDADADRAAHQRALSRQSSRTFRERARNNAEQERRDQDRQAHMQFLENSSWWTAQHLRTQEMEQEPRDPLRCTWGLPCAFCGAVLLDWETPFSCCKKGDAMLDPLPDLTPFLKEISTHRLIGESSLKINQTFHFASHAYSERRVVFGPGPPALAIEGTIYQRVFPMDRNESPLNLYLYNPERLDAATLDRAPQVSTSARV